MFKVIWALPCATVIDDRITNTISHINVIENASVSYLPASLPPLWISSQWETDKVGKHEVTVVIGHEDPLGEKVEILRQKVQAKINNDPTSKLQKVKVNLNVPSFKVYKEGRHVISFACFLEDGKDGDVIELPYTVKLLTGIQ
jgi:hypothetical protein